MDDIVYEMAWRSCLAIPGIIFIVTAFAYSSFILGFIGFLCCLPFMIWMEQRVEIERRRVLEKRAEAIDIEIEAEEDGLDD
jgi:hypothetical protein